MTRGQMEKAEFVMNCVEPMLAGIDPRISSVSYAADERGSEHVTIKWETDDGKLKDAVNVNVSHDSKAALVYDVIKIFL